MISLDSLSKILRCMIIPQEGKEFIGGDFSAIESRVLAWLAGQNDTLEVFRTGEDVYCHTASKIYGRRITKEAPERTIGKVATLALGYQGATGAFDNMAKVYGVTVPAKERQPIIDAWRRANGSIVRYWRALEDAAVASVSNPGRNYPVGRSGVVSLFRFDSSPWGGTLRIKLPSGRVLSYQKAKIVDGWKFGKHRKWVTYVGRRQDKKAWFDVDTYGGMWAENVTQAVARDVMVNSMFLVERLLPCEVVLTVHDELLTEAEKGAVEVQQFEHIMATPPVWAKDLPLAVEGWKGDRYTKV